MCFMLYVGTEKPLPTKEWKKHAPDVWVRPILEGEGRVIGSFSKPVIQYVGSTSGCGCDFPHRVMFNGNLNDFSCTYEDQEQFATYRQNRDGLADLLLRHGENSVELYGVWAGNEYQEPLSRQKISFNEFLSDAFGLGEQVFYELTIGN